MPKVRKLKSGSWNCQVMVNGKRESFTVKDPSINGKRKCLQQAVEWERKYRLQNITNKTIGSITQEYIDRKRDRLSPTTINHYELMLEKHLAPIADFPADDFSQAQAQEWADNLIANGMKVSTASNIAVFFKAVMKTMVGKHLTIIFPEKRQREYLIPTDDEVSQLLKYAHKNDRILERAIILAAFGTCRAGEVCAITYEDVKDNKIYINKTYAKYDGQYHIKAPKTIASTRTVELPLKAIKTLTSENRPLTERIVPITPDSLAHRFKTAQRIVGCTPFRFHDLRAYAVSVRHALGIPDQFIMADGGWTSPQVMIKIYRRAMEDKRSEFAKITNEHFDKIM